MLLFMMLFFQHYCIHTKIWLNLYIFDLIKFGIIILGVILLVIIYTAMGSIIFVSLEGENTSDYINLSETAVAASKPYPRSELENSDIRSR